MTPLHHPSRMSSASTDSLVSSASSGTSSSSYYRDGRRRHRIPTPRLGRSGSRRRDRTASSGSNDEEAQQRSSAGAGQSPLIASGIVSGDGLMLFITCFASLGVFLFGYDQGVMSGIITTPHFKSFFGNPSPSEIGTMVAVLEIGAFVTSLACGTLADTFGRKAILFWGALVFSIGGAIQTFTTGFTIMVLGRITAGLGVGVMSMVVPTYQSEISPAENRGKLACIEFTGNIIGYSASVWIGYLFSFLQSDLSWRIPLSFQSIIGLTLTFGSLLLPESPRWLLDHDRDDEAMRVLADLHGNGDPRSRKAKREFREIKGNVLDIREEEKERGRGYSEMFRRYKRRTFIACSAQMCAQLNGINVISYYAPNVFLAAGWIGRDAILMAGFNSISYVLATVPTWFLVDSWGRRPILLGGAIMCAVFLSGMGGFSWYDGQYTAQAVVACVVLFDVFHGMCWGAIPWLLAPEIMPLSFRAKGASLACATNWLFNYIVGEAVPILLDLISWRLYFIHAFFCLCSFALVFFTYPETAGKSLEEMDLVFGDAIPAEIDDEDDDDDDEEDVDDDADHRARMQARAAKPMNIGGSSAGGGGGSSSAAGAMGFGGQDSKPRWAQGSNAMDPSSGGGGGESSNGQTVQQQQQNRVQGSGPGGGGGLTGWLASWLPRRYGSGPNREEYEPLRG